MKTRSLVVAAFALSAGNFALAAEPAKPQPTLSDLMPKYTPSSNNDSGKMPPPPPPVPQTYPTVQQAPNGDPRLYVNKDVSVGGTVQPLSVNVQFPYSQDDKK